MGVGDWEKEKHNGKLETYGLDIDQRKYIITKLRIECTNSYDRTKKESNNNNKRGSLIFSFFNTNFFLKK
jgi:hypothetical protein